MSTATEEKEVETTEETAGVSGVYEIGYHILSTIKEDEVESVVAFIRDTINKLGGSLIAEGAPQSIKLAYPMVVGGGGKNTSYDRAYFGWIKFESDSELPKALEVACAENKDVLRILLFSTVREDTRAHVRTATLKEVKRTDTITSTPSRGAAPEGEKVEVSEEELDKAIEDITEE